MIRESIYKKYKKLVVISVVGVALTLTVFFSFLTDNKFLNVYHVLFYQSQAWSKSVLDRFAFLLKNYETTKVLQQQTIDLQKQLLYYENELNTYRRLFKRQEKISEDFKVSIAKYKKIKFLSANIISKDPQNLFSTLIIDKGKKDGLTNGMPVMGISERRQGALVGYLRSVGKQSSVVRTILDYRCQVSVNIGEENHMGLMRGQTPFKTRTLCDFIDINLENLLGQKITTSSYGGKYIRGIHIGEVVEIKKQNYGLFQKALVKPAINFFTIEDVFILKSKKL